MKTLRLARLALFLVAGAAALAPTVTQALPRSCDQVCLCNGSCNWKCNASESGIAITTCGEWGVCRGTCRADQPRPEAGQPALFADESASDARGCAQAQAPAEDAEPFVAQPAR